MIQPFNRGQEVKHATSGSRFTFVKQVSKKMSVIRHIKGGEYKVHTNNLSAI